jgi:hypothetical protein
MTHTLAAEGAGDLLLATSQSTLMISATPATLPNRVAVDLTSTEIYSLRSRQDAVPWKRCTLQCRSLTLQLIIVSCQKPRAAALNSYNQPN